MTRPLWLAPTRLVVATLAAISIVAGFGLASAVWPPASSPTSTASAPAVHYENLSIILNPANGAPQYTPANFTLVEGYNIVTITDYDSPGAWAGCGCVVSGTVGGTETVNGTPMHVVPNTNVAHTFSSPQLNLNVLVPGGGAVVSFEVYVLPGTYTWLCMAPCGADGYTGFPMDTPGYMTGTISVVAS